MICFIEVSEKIEQREERINILADDRRWCGLMNLVPSSFMVNSHRIMHVYSHLVGGPFPGLIGNPAFFEIT
jgi:hypothetical protein